MIQQQVEVIRKEFVEKWNTILNVSELYRLDGSWPSIGLIDRLTFNLRQVSELTGAQQKILTGASAYIAKLVHDCWVAAGAEVKVEYTKVGITIAAVKGPKLGEGQEFSVQIEKQLGKLLRECPREFPVLGDFTRIVGPDQNMVSLFVLGVATGLTPFGDGPWLQETVESFKPFIDSVVKVLASTSADCYGRIFKGEQLGQVAELYLNSLIYPPMLMGSELPAEGAVLGVLQFAKEFGFDSPAVLRLAGNLARMADDLMAHTGIVLVAAISAGDVPPSIVSSAQERGSFMGVFRRTMIHVREQLGLRGDWILEDELKADDVVRFHLEMKLGMLPWVTLPVKKALHKPFAPVMLALSMFDFKQAVELLDTIIAQNPGEIELRLQRTVFTILEGDLEGAVRDLKSLLTEPGCEDEPAIYNQLGLCELSLNQREQAVKHLEASYKLISEKTEEPHRLANDYAWALILEKRFEEALPVLNKALRTDQCPVTTLLNTAYALRELGRTEELTRIEEELINLAPLDRRVFGNLILPWILE